jgi:hypothetical protein
MPIADGVLTITPEDIKITDHLWDSFGQHETEVSAEWLVKFAQARGTGWTPFTYDDIEAFYSKSGRLRGFTFNRLISGGFIVLAKAGTIGFEDAAFVGYTKDVYHYTEDFIARCYKSASRKSA